MKINELISESEQINELFGLFKSDPAQKLLDKYVPGFMNKWNQYMSLASKSGSNPADPAFRIKVLSQMISYYTKPGRNDLIAINKAIKNAGNNITNDKVVKDIATAAISLALQKNIAPQQKKAKTKSQAGAPNAPASGIPSGHTIPLGGVDYVWNGSEWRNGTTMQPADAKTTTVLNQYAMKAAAQPVTPSPKLKTKTTSMARAGKTP